MTFHRAGLLTTSALLLVGMAATTSSAAGDAGFVLAPKAKPETAAKQTPEDNRQLRRLMADRNDLFLGGEIANREFAFLVLPSEMTGNAKLVLDLQSAISVAPERSTLRLFVNDQDLGSVPLTSGASRRVEIEIPKGRLQPGYNSLVMLADQFHRVDCSLDATYELWTQINPANSGLSFSRRTGEAGSDLSSLLTFGNVNGRTAIRTIVPKTGTTNDIDRTMAMVQALAIAGQLDRPAVTVAEQPEANPGIEMLVGTFGTVRQALGNAAGELSEGIRVSTDPETGKAQLIATARTDEDLNQVISRFETDSHQHYMDGTSQGRRAMDNRRGRLLEPASRTALSTLGFISRPFLGRHYDQSIAFNLPADFYPGDYGAATLNLNADYAAGLSPNAKLIVKANEETIASVHLGDGKSGRITNQHLPIPLNKLRPGKNIIRFEADLTASADAACDAQTLTSSTPRLHVKADSSLDMPVFAEVGHSPDLAVAMAGDFKAGANGNEPVPLYVENLRPASLGAAATLLARTAYLSGHVTPVSTTGQWPLQRDGALLAVGTFAGVGRHSQTDMLLDLSPSMDMSSPTASKQPSTQSPASLTFGGEQPDAARPAEPENRVEAYIAWAKGFGMSVVDRLHVQAEMLNLVPNPQVLAADQAYQMPGNADLVVAQRLVADRSPWTVIAARDEAVLQESVNAISQSQVWSGIGGTVQAFERSGKPIERKEAQHQELYETKPLSLKNGRLILAGWFANNSLQFTIAQIAAAMFLGMSTFVVLRRGRRKP
jgi:hypothetical protein